MALSIDPQQVVGTGVVGAERGVVQNDGGMSEGADTVGEENGRSSKPRLTPDLLIYQRSCVEIESVNGACMGTRSFHIATHSRHNTCWASPLLHSPTTLYII